MESEYKFNVGDKVVKLELDYFDNYFHYQKCITEYTVKCANERLFSVYYNEIPSYIPGSNDFGFCWQESGFPRHGKERLFHKEKDADLIKSLIDKAVERYDDFTRENDEKRLKELAEIIKNSKAEITEIKNGNGSWKRGFTVRKNKDYKEKVLDVISKVFPF